MVAFIFESVGGTEWLVLFGVVLIVVGPKNLPAAARKLGQIMTKVRRAADEFKRQLMSMDEEVRKAVDEAVSTEAPTTPERATASEGETSPSEDRAETDYYGGEYNPESPYPGYDYSDEENAEQSAPEEPSAPASEEKPVPQMVAPPPPPVRDPYAIKITVSTSGATPS